MVLDAGRPSCEYPPLDSAGGNLWETMMCRNIRSLFNFDPPATEDEIRAAALQFVRKLSGSRKPSQANAMAFDEAVDEVSEVVLRLLGRLVTNSPARNREAEAAKARARATARYG